MKDFISPQKAVEILHAGDVVAIPTETVYGLAAKIDNQEALKKIFSIKGRPFFDPLIVHIANLKMLSDLVVKPDPILLELAEYFWPGPLTLIFNKNPKTVSDLITADSNTVAVRWPKHKITEQIITELKSPLAAPSANPFKKTSPSEAVHVRNYFPNLDIVDGGQCSVGLESTIVRINNNNLEILRPGQISKTDLIKFLKTKNHALNVTENFNQEGPGSMKEHYQPEAPLYIFKHRPIHFDHLDFVNKKLRIIAFPNNPFLCARVLYKTLIEESKSTDILTLEWRYDEKDPNWSAIYNRLEKAAKVII